MNDQTSNTDKILFLQIAEDGEEAYIEIYNRYFDRLKWYAFRFLNSEFWADEIVEEVFVQLWISRGQLSAVEFPSSWLHKMTGNRCLNRIRKNKREIEIQYAISSMLKEDQPVYQQDQYDLRKLETLIREAIVSLPEQRRIIYELQQEQKMTYQEIADHLGISRHTVRNQVAKALETIRAYLLGKKDIFLVVAVVRFFIK